MDDAVDLLQPWELLDEVEAFETPWFTIKRRIYELPDGTKPTYFVHDTHDSVICVCVTDDDTVLIERQYRPAIDRVSIDYPSGRMEPEDDGTHAAIIRELKEETGYAAVSLREIATLDTNPGFSRTKLHVFLARGVVSGEAEPDANESIVAEFVPAAEVLRLVSSGEMNCTFCVSATLFAFRELGWISFAGEISPEQ